MKNDKYWKAFQNYKMNFNDRHEFWMRHALAAAKLAADANEVPVGAVLVSENNKVLAISRNAKENFKNEKPTPLGHAEILAIHRAAVIQNSWRLSGCTLYVTLEPCLMCAGAILQARISRLVFAASDPKGGAVTSLYQVLGDSRLNHQVEVVSGVLADESSRLLKTFFKGLRKRSR